MALDQRLQPSLATVYDERMNTESTDRKARYRAKRQQQGMSQVTVWCPTRDRERIQRYAAGLSKTFEKEMKKAKEAE